jgi:hypothetical protein
LLAHVGWQKVTRKKLRFVSHAIARSSQLRLIVEIHGLVSVAHMDSTLLDQIRHLCRDRAAYEHLKAILVQQERVHQLSCDERYEKLVSERLLDAQPSELFSNDLFINIIAREKALAQLAETIVRSLSLELVIPIALQVAQKILQVDRVAIFRRHSDGRGEFVNDAIASGVMSLVDMPEKQLSLARYMIESTQTEEVGQTVDSIRSSSLSAHIVNLFEQIGISSYVANQIYAGQEIWGTLVAFTGGAYYSWTESDRTSLSLIAAQIGIAISLNDLRQQSLDLTNDLQTLQMKLDDLQQTVASIAKSEAAASIAKSDAAASIVKSEVPSLMTEVFSLDLSDDLDEQARESGLEESELEELKAQIDVQIEVAQPLLTEALLAEACEGDRDPAIDPLIRNLLR